MRITRIDSECKNGNKCARRVRLVGYHVFSPLFQAFINQLRNIAVKHSIAVFPRQSVVYALRD